MTQNNRVIRLERNGPTDNGMREVECDPAGFRPPLPTQHAHVYVEDKKVGLSVSVRERGQMVSKMLPFPTHEFVRVFEGEVTI